MNTLLERAASIREAEIRTAQVDLAEWRRRYVEILSRQDAPEPRDAEDLLDVAAELRLPDAQVQADAALVARYMRLSASAVQYDSLHVLEVKAREDLKCLRRESEKAIQTADSEQTKMSNRASMSCLAQSEVQILQRQRPDLFAPTG